MRKSLLQWLVCPVCGDELTLKVICCQGGEIVEGTLYCRCGQTFPIIGGVPRLLCNPLRKQLPKLYPDFYQRNLEHIDGGNLTKAESVNNFKKSTIYRFGYEWKQFSDYDCNNFEVFIAPLAVDFFNGKLGLDVGCGAGRHARQTSEMGAEIVSIDISTAVDAACYHNADNDMVHVVQADIYNLPFNHGIFDFIYSLGVLHHLPDPELGYQTLIPLLARGGVLFVWVYAYAMRKVALEVLRFISQRLSNTNVRRMAYLCNLIDYGIFINPYRILAALPFIGMLAKQYFPSRIKEYATHGFRVGYTDWFDRLSAPITNYYKENEMQTWLQRSGLSNTRLQLEGDSWWWLYGERKA